MKVKSFILLAGVAFFSGAVHAADLAGNVIVADTTIQAVPVVEVDPSLAATPNSQLTPEQILAKRRAGYADKPGPKFLGTTPGDLRNI